MIEKKLLLADIRTGDYTHAGEKEAIDLVMNKIEKDPKQHLLDVGCGLGGTAAYLQDNGWGEVTGIDIDENAINHATKHYPHLEFIQCAADKVNESLEKKFDVVYLFNAYYCFLNQTQCLNAFSKIAKPNGILALFDYSSPNKYKGNNPFHDEKNKPFTPINLKAAMTDFSENCWDIVEIIDLTPHYISWYRNVINNLKTKENTLTEKFGETAYNLVISGFVKVLKLLQSGDLGGSVVYATKI